MVPNQFTVPRNSTDSTTHEYTWHRTYGSCWHVTYVSGRTLGDQEGLYSPLLEIGVPVSAVSGLHFVFFRKMPQCLPCQMDSPEQEKRICNVYLLFYTEERWKGILFTVKKKYPGIPPDSIWLASVTSLLHTSNCHFFNPKTPLSTRPVCSPTRMFNATSVLSQTILKFVTII